jgi:L-ascorbate metabolism protein UlaG (beta-lactamase superfamily)
VSQQLPGPTAPLAQVESGALADAGPSLPSVESTPIPTGVRERHAAYFQPPDRRRHFRNPWPHPRVPGLREVLRWRLRGNTLRAPGYKARPLAMPDDAYARFMAQPAASTRLFWIGHASFLCELDGARFVIDPIFGRAGGLVPRVTPAAVAPAQLTDIAAVLVTHGHHDHCDPRALAAIAEVNQGRTLFVVPRGMSRKLPRACRRVVELGWWQFVQVAGVRLHFVPAQHWHQRSPFDMNRTLWGGFVLEGRHRVYHSGDTSYFGGFAAIGDTFGSIDAACLPLGAYEPRWFMSSQHMNPDESLAALLDLRASHFVGMHWAAYDLSDEPIGAGPARALALAPELGLDPERMHVICPGGSVTLEGERGGTRATTAHRYLTGSALTDRAP